MKDELCWSDAIYGPNGRESGYAPTSCGIYITKKDLGWCKVEFKDRKIIIDDIKFDNRGITNGMLVKIFKNETINISNFKFFNDVICSAETSSTTLFFENDFTVQFFKFS